MLVGVITPYYKESLEQLERNHKSVLEQTHPDMLHVMIADGHPREEIDGWERVVHIKLPPHNDYGDTPRAIGALSAVNKGCEALTLLDADNFFCPNHAEELLKVHQQTGCQVITGTRNLLRTDLSFMAVDTESDGVNFNDTNCFLFMKPALYLFSAWGYKNPKDGIIGDRVFWNAVKDSGFPRAHCSVPTVNYVTRFAFHYQQHNEAVPENGKVIVRFNGQDHNEMLSYQEYVKLTGREKV